MRLSLFLLISTLLTSSSWACELINEEFLSWPSDDSVIVSVVTKSEANVRVEYGKSRASLGDVSETVATKASELAAITLSDLSPDTKYFYRLICNNVPRETRSFNTARAKESKFSFAFGTDSHYYRHWASSKCGKRKSGLTNFLRTMKNVSRRRPDFMVVGGDWAQTQCYNCNECSVDDVGAGSGNVKTQEHAMMRHRQTRRGHERIAHSVPMFFVLGNHEGEADFYASDYRCNTPELVPEVSRIGRLAYYPAAPDSFDAGEDSNYYSFTWGDALFVVLDVMRYTAEYPSEASDWTLETEQLKWLESVLSSSESKWKFVFMEHLVGGVEGSGCYYYGRGGIRATDTGEMTGTFLGQQAQLHDLFKAHGVQLVFYGHDHVFSFAEKLNAEGVGDGVHYLCGGRLAKTRRDTSKWKKRKWFQKLYDHSGDGKADFLGNEDGSSIGFTNVTVYGSDKVELKVFETHRKKSKNNQVIFSHTIQ